jgi:hypothetical protein
MKTEIKKMISVEIEDVLELFTPNDKRNFGTWIKLMIGTESEVGCDYFDIFVCTPEWLRIECMKEGFVWGRHTLIVEIYDLDAIKKILSDRITDCNDSNWKKIALNISQYASWEYEVESRL